MSWYITYSRRDLPAIDPLLLYRECVRTGIPTHKFWGKANSFTSLRGRHPSRAYLLLPYRDAKLVSAPSLTHHIFFRSDIGDINRAEPHRFVSHLLLTNMEAVTGSQQLDDATIMLVEFSDKRHLASMSSINRSYNVRINTDTAADVPISPTPFPYYKTTHHPAADGPGFLFPHSYAALIRDIWDTHLKPILTLSLDFTEAALPPTSIRAEEYHFFGISAWDALFQVLDDVHHTIRVDPETGTFQLIPLGRLSATEDADQTARDNAARDNLVLDAHPTNSNLARYPQHLSIHFPSEDYAFHKETEGDTHLVHPYDRWRTNPYHVINLPTNLPHAVPGTKHVIHDNLPARFTPDGVLTNTTDLTARANDIRTNYLENTLTNRLRTYHGLWQFRTNPHNSAVSWYDIGQGMQTRVLKDYRHDPPPNFHPLSPEPPLSSPENPPVRDQDPRERILYVRLDAALGATDTDYADAKVLSRNNANAWETNSTKRVRIYSAGFAVSSGSRITARFNHQSKQWVHLPGAGGGATTGHIGKPQGNHNPFTWQVYEIYQLNMSGQPTKVSPLTLINCYNLTGQILGPDNWHDIIQVDGPEGFNHRAQVLTLRACRPSTPT